ncbi:MAG TPA: flagellar hook-associated family protein [Roseiarcus sp.]|jgi:flagellar hook-associated protein 3 FlgL
MTTTNISSNYLTTAMLPSIAQTQATLAADGVELSTGQYANLGLQLGDQSGYELSLKNEYQQLQSLTTSNTVVTTDMTTAQDALNAILSDAQSAQSSLTTWTSNAATSSPTLETIGADGLQALTSMANTTSNGAYVFGGVNNGVAPMNDYFSTPASAASTAVSNAFTSALTAAGATPSTISASDMQTFLNGPFAALFTGSSWTSDWSNASSTNTTAEIAPGQTSVTSTNINQPGFQDITEGYTMLAAFGNAGLSPSAQQAVASTALSLISQGVTALTSQTANLGSSMAQVTNATNSMSSQMTILQTQIGNLDNVNSSAVATQLTQLSTQLETAYQLTSQITKLSLAQYLPVA